MSVLPLRLPDTDAKAGYDQIDPVLQWFLAGDTAPPAQATGISDDTRYGLDLRNSGAGGLSLRAISGDGTKSIKVDNTGVAISGLSIAGTTTFTNVTLTGTLDVTGAATLRSSLTVGGAMSVTGAMTVTGLATFVTNVVMNQGLTIAQSGSVTGNWSVAGSLTVTQTATFVSNVTMSQGLTIAQSGSVTGNWVVGGTLTVTGVSTFVTNVTMSQGLAISQSGSVGGNWTIGGNLAHTGSNIGFFGSAPSAKETVNGSRAGNAALASLLSALANYGILTNSSSA